MSRHSNRDGFLIRWALEEFDRETLPTVDGNVDVYLLPLADRNRIREALGKLFAQYGLREDSEPNKLGLIIDDLIGALGPSGRTD